MAAISASQRRINGHPISGLYRLNLTAHLHHSSGGLMPHHHACLSPAAFPRKPVHIAAADSDCIRANKQFLGTKRRCRSLLNGELPGTVELEEFHSREEFCKDSLFPPLYFKSGSLTAADRVLKSFLALTNAFGFVTCARNRQLVPTRRRAKVAPIQLCSRSMYYAANSLRAAIGIKATYEFCQHSGDPHRNFFAQLRNSNPSWYTSSLS
jgi:hypothetical protein